MAVLGLRTAKAGWSKRQRPAAWRLAQERQTDRRQLVIDALVEGGILPEDPDSDRVILVDCRTFYDPSRHGFGHLGTNAEVLQRFVANANFAPMMAFLHRNLMRLRREPRRTAYFVFFCNRGRHRSVAGATLIANALEASREQLCVAPALEIQVLNQEVAWQGTCGGPQMCSSCRDLQARDPFHEVARTHWQGLLAGQ